MGFFSPVFFFYSFVHETEFSYLFRHSNMLVFEASSFREDMNESHRKSVHIPGVYFLGYGSRTVFL